jgi:Tol biopolymer transport system component
MSHVGRSGNPRRPDPASWVVPRAGAPATRLTEDDGFDALPAWSPDGREIAYDSRRDGQWDLWIVPAEGGEARQLTKDPADAYLGTWSPDGSRLAFLSVRHGSWDIWVIPPVGGEPAQLTSDGAATWLPFWSPDGRWIIFRASRPGSTLWRVPADGGEVEPFLNGGRSPRWSTDGDKIYFIAQREGRANLYGADTGATSSERQLTDFVGKPGYLATLADTDGDSLYFTWREDHGELWVMDVDENQ